MRMWQTIRASVLGRHVHEKAYAALVLSGGYEEAGDHGRFRVKAGDVIFHEPFEAHLDRFSETGAVVLNRRLPFERSYAPGTAKVADPDSVVRTSSFQCRSRPSPKTSGLRYGPRLPNMVGAWSSHRRGTFPRRPTLRP